MAGSWVAALALSLGACSPEAAAPKLEGEELAAALADENIFLLDVRDPWELEELGTVEGYVNIPIDQLEDRLDEVPRDKRILTA
jgi:predicted sulfurtransferase